MFVEIEGIESPLEVVFNAERRIVAKGEVRNVTTCHVYTAEKVCIGFGEAIKNPIDTYDSETGQRIAMKRAFDMCLIFRLACFAGKPGFEWRRNSWSRFRYAYWCTSQGVSYSFTPGGEIYNMPDISLEEAIPF